MSTVRVAALRRFPVKSMGGESLDRVELRADGLAGDRSLIVEDERGMVTARVSERLLGHDAALEPDGSVTIDGHPWHSESAARLISAAAGQSARLVRAPGGHLWDDRPILVTTDGAIAELGELDPLRFRANIHLTGVEGRSERGWVGRRLRFGETATLEVELTCKRCKITTIDPRTLEVDPEVLRRINRELGRRLGVLGRVETPGTIALGDPVEVL